MIAAAQRPVLYIGGGIAQARAQALALAFAERASVPTTTTLMALGSVPTDHPLALGMLGMHGARYTTRVIDEGDLLIAIGCRFADLATGRLDRFPPNAKRLQLDADLRDLAQMRQPDLAIQADAAPPPPSLNPAVQPH